jgi:hypothetical protein
MNKCYTRVIISVLMVVLLLVLSTACSARNGKDKDAAVISTVTSSNAIGQTNSGDTAQVGNSEFSSEENGKEAKYYPSPKSGFKYAYNENFDFWFDLLEDWKAFDRSENGDGYFIVSENPKMDIRVYGMYKTGTDEEFYNELAGKKGTVENFTFDDGVVGKRIFFTGSKVYYVHGDVDTYICFYVNFKNDQAWYEANNEKLNEVAASLRTQELGPKLDDGTNKITLDDLKLGDIVIDMPYKKVKEIMESVLTKEETDELGGKTLFYNDNTEIYIVDDTVYTMNVTNSNYPTPRGLKVGDDEARVKDLYGEPDNKEDATHWGYTYDGYELFTVILEDGKVSELQIDMVR